MAADLLTAPPDAATVAAGLRGQGAAGLAAALRAFTGPATELFAWIVSEGGQPAPMRIDVHHRVVRALTSAECAYLSALAVTMAEDRQGMLYAGSGRRGLAAQVQSVVITSLLPPGCVTDLRGDVPLGLVLARYARREPQGAVPYMGGVASTGRMWIGEFPVATASEHVQPWVCKLLERPGGG